MFSFVASARPWVACVLVLTCAAARATVHPQDTPSAASQAADELESTLREMRNLRAGYYGNKRAQAAEIIAVRNMVANLRTAVAELEAEQVELVGDSQTIRAESATLAEEKAVLTGKADQMLMRITSFGETIRPLVTDGLPYRQDARLRAIDGFQKERSVCAAFARMWTFVEDELRVARSGETYSEEIALGDGRAKNARFARIGKHMLGFVTEDGVDVGVWMHGTGWVTDPARFQHESVRTAVEVLDRRRGPEHVLVPIRIQGDASR